MISLVRPIAPETGRIRAEGKVLNCGRRVGTAEGHAFNTVDRCNKQSELSGLYKQERRSNSSVIDSLPGDNRPQWGRRT
jgi:hypothetical protein